ncbi:glycosyltransferase family 2 protein [Microbacteriaceae bacterium VKM Ac-2855]|nr:glycosyltransferase family 2 protein [Microbacteriaceae bacterium VKM Ac-2855]
MNAHVIARRLPMPSAANASASVSVLMPLYDYARYLEEAAASVLSQEGVQVQLVIVDDHSNDDGLAVARRIAAADPRVAVIASAVNRGPVAAVNAALEVATGEFLWYLDADDLVTPGALARAVAVARAHPSVSLVYGHPLHYSGPTPPTPRTDASGILLFRGTDWLADRCRTGLNVITSCEVLLRRSAVDEVGGPSPLPHTYDMEWWMRVASVGDVAYVQGVDQAWHREHPGSRSAENATPLIDLFERRRAFVTFFDLRTPYLEHAASLRAEAERALAAGALEKACQLLDGGHCGPAEASGYEAFALATCGRARELPEWRRWQSRKRLGERWTQTDPRFLVERVVRRLRSDRSWRAWETTGLFR